MSTPSKGKLWAGRILTVLPSLALVMSASMKLSHSPQIVENWTKFGFPENTLMPIGVVELLCLAIYLVPRTAVLGAVLLTGYLGGAIVTHVRAGEPFIAPLVVALLFWGGIYFREERLHALLPLRKPE